MGLVKLRKDLSYDAFMALPEKDGDTIYFLNDTNRIYLGDTPYGGKDIFVENSESIGLTFIDDTLEASAILSSEDGNALELKADGLYAPPATVPFIKNQFDNDLVVSVGDAVDDSCIAIVDELNENSNDWMVPSVAAVYEAISKVAPKWNSDTVDDSFLPQDLPKREWLDYTDKLTDYNAPFLDIRSYLVSNGATVRFCISSYLSDVNLSTVFFQFPAELAPKQNKFFSFSVFTDPPGEFFELQVLEKSGYLCIDTFGAIRYRNIPSYSNLDLSSFFVFTGEYEI
ncbi:MAG: hypothetical protein LBC41_16525 [Clostridiales bacterium]|jgi:hypothetical protein|nr:hypothetical protein [Clostridiales bacterium]